ncbi:hypothetical protein AVEN_196183-1, partial [Araneus ventricosus]
NAIFSFIKSFLISVIYPAWTNLVVQVYCLLCHRISKLLSDFTTEIDGCSPQEFTVSKQANILQKESRSHQAILHVQSIFSAPSFLVCTAHFCTCITVLTALIVQQNTYAYFTAIITFCLYFLNSSGGLLACLWIAGGPPNNANKFKEAFGRKIQEKKLRVDKTKEVFCVDDLNGLSHYTLSGALCDDNLRCSPELECREVNVIIKFKTCQEPSSKPTDDGISTVPDSTYNPPEESTFNTEPSDTPEPEISEEPEETTLP